MTRLLCLTLGIAIASGCALQTSQSSALEGSTMKTEDLQGVYEFVSDSVVLTKPQSSTTRRTSPEWVGMWLFLDGRFTQTLMKQKRSWDPFPVNQQELGYQSSTGTYKIDGTHIFLKHEFSLNPRGVSQLTVVDYRLDGGGTLSMTRKMSPQIEDLSEGEQVTILRKIK
jgi:hypothetical protein